ncbi:MAG: precorrin-8X methylmutase [Dissulfuribacterales bacterium]
MTSLPEDIERQSFEIIDGLVPEHDYSPAKWLIVRRMIHSTGDVEFAKTTRFHADAVACGVKALKRGCTVITDTQMLLAGISTGRLRKLGAKAICYISEDDVRADAVTKGITRAMAAMDKALPVMNGSIVAIGNAPTALLRLMEHVDNGLASPALIIGLPVGFVNCFESKEMLASKSYPFITSLGPKGGSGLAASVVNALAIMALQ